MGPDQKREYDRIVRNHRRLIAACQQTINDVQSWNDNRTDCPPMDCEPERVLKRWVEQRLAEFIEQNATNQ